MSFTYENAYVNISLGGDKLNREEFIKQLIISKYGTIKNFSKFINVPYTTICSILERSIGKAGIDNVIKICKGLEISPEQLSNDFSLNKCISNTLSTMYLLNDYRQQKVYDFAKHELEEQKEQKSHITVLEKYKENEKKEKEYVDIFWYGSASAGTGQFLFSNKELISLPKEQVPIGADFCLTVSGDSMEPVLHNGDYIFVTKQNTLFNRSIGVVIVDGEAFIKKVFFENDKARLQSFNKKYKDIIVDDSNDFRIIGKAVL